MLSPSEYFKAQHPTIVEFVPVDGGLPCVSSVFDASVMVDEEHFNSQVIVNLLETLSSHRQDNMVLCNSERYTWLPNFFNNTKPDFFVMNVFFVTLTEDTRYEGENDNRVFAIPADKMFSARIAIHMGRKVMH